jgi:hypothetical protein
MIGWSERPRNVCHGRAGLKERVQGVDGRGPLLLPPDGNTDTGMSIASRREGARGRPVGAAGCEQRSARSDRLGRTNLDAISVASVPDGPFGQDLRYGVLARSVNAFSHQLLRAVPPPSTTCGQVWTDGGQGGLETAAAAIDRLQRVVDPKQHHHELEDDPPPQVAGDEGEQARDGAA